MELSKNIKKFRKDRNMTQKDLAEKSGLSIASIQGYEQGKYMPKTEQLKKIATALEVSVNDINPEYGELFQSNILCSSIYDRRYKPSSQKRDASDILFDQIKQDIVSRNILPEQEYNDLMRDKESILGHTFSYKIAALDIMKTLNENGWKELFQYAQYLATNPKYRINSESHEPTEEK